MDGSRRAWVASFEFGPVQLGGLGQVVTNQVKHLQGQVAYTVFMPAHGLVHGPPRPGVVLEDPGHVLSFPQRFDGIWGSEEHGFRGRFPTQVTVEVIPYLVHVPGYDARIVAFSGRDPVSRQILDDPTIYSQAGLKAKIALFSSAFKQYTTRAMEHDPGTLPDVIHFHDYHPAPAAIAARQVLMDGGLDVATIYTVHLLTWPSISMDYLACCGVSNVHVPCLVHGRRLDEPVSRLVDMASHRLEFLAAIFADLVTSVSKSYLEEDVIPTCGGDMLAGKTDFIHNGCDWELDRIQAAVLADLGPEIQAFHGGPATGPAVRPLLRRFLLEWKVANLASGEPLLDDAELAREIDAFAGVHPFTGGGHVAPFSTDGPLAILTGRASAQKGIETIFEALPRVLDVHPGFKFIFFLLPTQGERHLIHECNTRATSPRLRDNVRVLWGRCPSAFHLAHLAADFYVAPSRWEPFGIMVLEAHAMGLPVIATRVGGIKETVIDHRDDPAGATGVLVQKDDVNELAAAMIMMIDAARDPGRRDLPSHELMRRNARQLVETRFRWRHVSKKELSLLDTALASARARR